MNSLIDIFKHKSKPYMLKCNSILYHIKISSSVSSLILIIPYYIFNHDESFNKAEESINYIITHNIATYNYIEYNSPLLLKVHFNMMPTILLELI